jgi:hypothetical protein
VKGQQQLNVGKDVGTEITHIQPYKYDQEVLGIAPPREGGVTRRCAEGYDNR